MPGFFDLNKRDVFKAAQVTLQAGSVMVGEGKGKHAQTASTFFEVGAKFAGLAADKAASESLNTQFGSSKKTNSLSDVAALSQTKIQ